VLGPEAGTNWVSVLGAKPGGSKPPPYEKPFHDRGHFSPYDKPILVGVTPRGDPGQARGLASAAGELGLIFSQGPAMRLCLLSNFQNLSKPQSVFPDPTAG
jgi:hypothetical protein